MFGLDRRLRAAGSPILSIPVHRGLAVTDIFRHGDRAGRVQRFRGKAIFSVLGQSAAQGRCPCSLQPQRQMPAVGPTMGWIASGRHAVTRQLHRLRLTHAIVRGRTALVRLRDADQCHLQPLKGYGVTLLEPIKGGGKVEDGHEARRLSSRSAPWIGARFLRPSRPRPCQAQTLADFRIRRRLRTA